MPAKKLRDSWRNNPAFKQYKPVGRQGKSVNYTSLTFRNHRLTSTYEERADCMLLEIIKDPSLTH